MTARELYNALAAGKHSLAISNGGKTWHFDGRGIADLYKTYTTAPELLLGATVADKIVGKGAAALMIAGGVARLYAGTISKGALALIKDSAVETEYRESVDHIINRAGNGWCPVELLCRDCLTATDCLPLIHDFINQYKVV